MTPDLPNISRLDSKEALGGMFSIIMMVLHVYQETLWVLKLSGRQELTSHIPHGRVTSPEPSNLWKVFFQLPIYIYIGYKSSFAHLLKRFCRLFFFFRKLLRSLRKVFLDFFPKLYVGLWTWPYWGPLPICQCLWLLGPFRSEGIPCCLKQSSCKRKVDITYTPWKINMEPQSHGGGWFRWFSGFQFLVIFQVNQPLIFWAVECRHYY